MLGIIKWLRLILGLPGFRRSTQQDQDRIDWWRDGYRKRILSGDLLSDENRKTAEGLGLDVADLASEQRRMMAERRWIAIGLDLAQVKLNDEGRPLENQFPEWKSEQIPLAQEPVTISIPGIGIWGQIGFPTAVVSISEILHAAVNLIVDKLENSPADFRHSLPRGIQDLIFNDLQGSASAKSWTLMGERKAELRDRTASTLFPTKSIDLVRAKPVEAPGIKVQSWPELDHIFVRVSRWPSGEMNILDVCETRKQCGPEHLASGAGQPDTVNLRYPCEGSFRWEGMNQASPAANFLKAHTFRRAGGLAGKLQAYEIASVLCDFSKPQPAHDYRASIRSGNLGPAPMPRGVSWPSCCGCGEPQVFVESIDFRDVPFAHLLPGSTLVIFMCVSCVHQGNWSDCTSLVWLPVDVDVELAATGRTSPLVEARQWLGHDYSEIPDTLMEKLRDAWPSDLPWFGCFFENVTKAGGLPHYLQGEEQVFDSSACRMEFIGQFAPSDALFNGYGYLLHSTTTGETVAILQTT